MDVPTQILGMTRQEYRAWAEDTPGIEVTVAEIFADA